MSTYGAWQVSLPAAYGRVATDERIELDRQVYAQKPTLGRIAI